MNIQLQPISGFSSEQFLLGKVLVMCHVDTGLITLQLILQLTQTNNWGPMLVIFYMQLAVSNIFYEDNIYFFQTKSFSINVFIRCRQMLVHFQNGKPWSPINYQGSSGSYYCYGIANFKEIQLFSSVNHSSFSLSIQPLVKI